MNSQTRGTKCPCGPKITTLMKKPIHNDYDTSITPDISIHTLLSKSSKTAEAILSAIQALERRTFPSSECLSISTETSKRNTHLLYAQCSSTVVAYVIYINTSSGLRIHKVCVAESFRRKGMATILIERICQVAKKSGKDIDLWVDEARVAARECYTKAGFRIAGETVVDYYGPGRNGVRMVWTCT